MPLCVVAIINKCVNSPHLHLLMYLHSCILKQYKNTLTVGKKLQQTYARKLELSFDAQAVMEPRTAVHGCSPPRTQEMHGCQQYLWHCTIDILCPHRYHSLSQSPYETEQEAGGFSVVAGILCGLQLHRT